jgi:WD40 repeat protein
MLPLDLARHLAADGKRLAATANDNSVKVWDSTTGRELLILRGRADAVTSIAFSPDRRRLATCSWDNTAKLWDAATGRELLTLRGHRDMLTAWLSAPMGGTLSLPATTAT